MRFIICVAARTQAIPKRHLSLIIGQLIIRKSSGIGPPFLPLLLVVFYCYMAFLFWLFDVDIKPFV